MRLLTFAVLSLSTSLVAGHARIRQPKPLDAPPENPSGNTYNAPLAPNGSEFPCKNLHKKAGVDKTPTESWRAGSVGLFEILGHVTAGEGALAAHSGGSCQASISFDDGLSFHVLHTYHGGCPRDVPFGSNIAGPNQTFTFDIPPQTKSGPALFSWTWTAATGNRDEFYMNCAAIEITGGGTSTLDDYPDMFVGDMDLPGQIADGECRSIAGTAILYPDPGPAERITVTTVAGLRFQEPTKGNCFAPGGKLAQGSSSVIASSSAVGSSSAAVSSSPAIPTIVSTPSAIPTSVSTAPAISTTPGSAYIVPTVPGSTYIAPISTPGSAYIAPTIPGSTYIAPISTPGSRYIAPTPTLATPEPSDISAAEDYGNSTPEESNISPDYSDLPTSGSAYIAPTTLGSTYIASISTPGSQYIAPTPTLAIPEPSNIPAADGSDFPTPEESDLPYSASAPSAVSSDAPHSSDTHTHYRHTHYRTTITTTICPCSSSSTCTSTATPSTSSGYAGWKHRRHRGV